MSNDFVELLAAPGVREDCELRPGAVGALGFMAFHGGNLEEMTDIIASAAAARSGASYYGVVQPRGMEWHIPSHHVRREHSPQLDAFLSHVHTVITIHGYGRRHLFTSLLVGGRNRALAAHVGVHLRRHLPAYRIVTELDDIPKELRGQHQDNPVNVPANGGVQIELPPRVRGSSPLWWDWEGPGLTPHTDALVTGLAVAAHTWADQSVL